MKFAITIKSAALFTLLILCNPASLYIESEIGPQETPLRAQTVCVVGAGNVGLPTGLLAADAGFTVHIYDTDANKIALLKSGFTTLPERDIKGLLTANLKNPHLSFGTKPITAANFYVIAVPTPFVVERKEIDTSHLWQAIKTIAPLLAKGSSVLLTSTIPLFLTNKVAEYLQEQTSLNIGADIFVAYCPEPLLPGNSLYELSHNSRLIGGVSPMCSMQAAFFYQKLTSGEIYQTTARKAEFVKPIENSWRNIQIAFANQLDEMCTAAGVDTRDIIELANKHPRVEILQPGCGVGGSGMAVLPWTLVNAFPEKTGLICLARTINDERPRVILERINTKLDTLLKKNSDKKLDIALWGVTFKPNATDIRQSPPLQITQTLLKQDNPRVTYHVVEPNTSTELEASLGFTPETDPKKSLDTCDGIITLVNHDAFKPTSYISTAWFLEKIVLDACGIEYETQKALNEGRYFGGNCSSNKSPIPRKSYGSQHCKDFLN